MFFSYSSDSSETKSKDFAFSALSDKLFASAKKTRACRKKYLEMIADTMSETNAQCFDAKINVDYLSALHDFMANFFSIYEDERYPITRTQPLRQIKRECFRIFEYYNYSSLKLAFRDYFSSLIREFFDKGQIDWSVWSKPRKNKKYLTDEEIDTELAALDNILSFKIKKDKDNKVTVRQPSSHWCLYDNDGRVGLPFDDSDDETIRDLWSPSSWVGSPGSMISSRFFSPIPEVPAPEVPEALALSQKADDIFLNTPQGR